jgi:hypothetical protein
MKAFVKKLLGELGKKNVVLSAIFSLLVSFLTSDRWTYVLLHRYFDGLTFVYQALILLGLALIYFPFITAFFYIAKRLFAFFLPPETLSGLFPRPTDAFQARILKIIALLGVGFIVIFLLCNLFGQMNLFTWVFDSPLNTIRSAEIGNDFRVGIYRPAKALTEYFNIYPMRSNDFSPRYPPLVNVFGLPFLLFNENTAYLVQVVLLYLLNIACVGLSCLLVNKIFFAKLKADAGSIGFLNITIFILFSVFAVTSYPFIFSMERGNYDIVAFFFALLGIWCVITQPKKVWLQVLLISIAFHLKIYPGILFVLLLIKHGKKMLLPAVVINLGLFFIIGPQNAFGYIQSFIASMGSGNVIGSAISSSGLTFANRLVEWHPAWAAAEALWAKAFTLLPLLLWLISLLILRKDWKTPRGELLMFAASIPPMVIVPSIAYDYKLVIFVSTFLVLLAGALIAQYVQKNSSGAWIGMILFFGLSYFSARYFDPNYQVPFWINDKYPTMIAAQVFLLAVIIIEMKNSQEPTRLIAGE